MKRTLFVAAIAALAAAPSFAQSQVTLYGRLNVSVESQKIGDAGSVTKVANDASRVGLKGIEDLGGGLKAGFQLEHGFDVDTGAQSQSTFWARQSEVNLSGSFGTIRLGNFFSEAYYATADYVSLHNHDTGSSSDALYAYIGRNTNKVAYRTPELMKGLTAEVSLSAGEGGGNERNYDGAINYKSGGLHLGLGYEKAGDAKQFGLRALYETGPFIFGGYIQRDKNGFAADAGNRTTIRVSAAYLAGLSEFHVNVGRAGDYADIDNSSAKQYTLAYNYNLSKRTKVYALYSKVSDSAADLYGDFKTYGVGVRHNF